MYEVTVKVTTMLDLSGKSNEEVLLEVKKTIGLYSEFDVSKLVEVTDYKKLEPKGEA